MKKERKQLLVKLLKQYKSEKVIIKQGNDQIIVQQQAKTIMFKGSNIVDRELKFLKPYGFKMQVKRWNSGFKFQYKDTKAMSNFQRSMIPRDMQTPDNKKTIGQIHEKIWEINGFISSLYQLYVQAGSFFDQNIERGDTAYIQGYRIQGWNAKSFRYQVRTTKQVRQTMKKVQKEMLEGIEKLCKTAKESYDALIKMVDQIKKQGK